ncbi:MAG: virulence RhuM family protein [Rhodobacteraceae bacterium]|nr:virulence RhuM family protein [Paracoccaceae bacterium]
MGLQTWPHDNIRKNDVTVSKNFLAKAEIKELNRLTTILLDIFEDQLEIGRLVLIQDAERLLDKQLANLGRVILHDGGHVNKKDADNRAFAHYANFKDFQKKLRHSEADQSIQELAKEAKGLPKSRKRT